VGFTIQKRLIFTKHRGSLPAITSDSQRKAMSRKIPGQGWHAKTELSCIINCKIWLMLLIPKQSSLVLGCTTGLQHTGLHDSEQYNYSTHNSVYWRKGTTQQTLAYTGMPHFPIRAGNSSNIFFIKFLAFSEDGACTMTSPNQVGRPSSGPTTLSPSFTK